MPRLPRVLRTLFRKQQLEQELGDELRSYVEHLTAEKQAAGLDRDAARRAALMEIGGMEQVKEHVRGARPGALFEQLAQDARHGLRGLTRHPRFGAAIVLTLGLATGATSALFGIVDAVLLRSLPYREPERLVMLHEQLGTMGPWGFSAPDYAGFKERSRSYEAIAAFQNKTYELSGVESPERVVGARVSAELFRLLGVAPALGRDIAADEDGGAKPVVLLSDGLWTRKFGRDPKRVGGAIVLDRTSYTVVGVMPAGLVFPSRGPLHNDRPADVYVPMSFTPQELSGFGSMYNKSTLARLKPGVSAAEAGVEAKALASQIVRELYPAAFQPQLAILVAPFRDEVVGRVRTPLFGLFAAISILLLIACADVANLILTRGVARERELAVRAALGASRARLVRQLLVETTVLALLGGALGLLLARVGLALFVAWAPASLPRAHEIGVDARVLAFALVLSLLTGLVSGALPAWEAGRRAPVDTLKEAGRGGGRSTRQRRMLGALVSLQFALSAVLLVAGGLLGRSLQRLLAIEPGFRPERVLTMAISLPASGYPDGPKVRGFYETLLERSSSLPGVRAVSISSFLPLGVSERRAFTIEAPPEASARLPRAVAHDWVAGRYFETMGIELRRGRFLDDRDRAGSEPVIVINETMARQFWPAEDALDRRIKWGGETSSAPWMRIVGIVGDVKQGPLNERTFPQIWQPWRQAGDRTLAENVVGMARSLRLSLRSDVEPGALVASVRAEVRRLDSALPITEVQTLEDVLRASTGPQRWNGWLFGAFAVVALLLAAVGVGGVLAESVSRRTHEIGVRLVLGAERAHVMKLVLREGLVIAGLGVLVGLPAALALTRLLSSLLFEVSPRDPLIFGAVAVVLAGAALLACAIPAFRATRVDPATALRHD